MAKRKTSKMRKSGLVLLVVLVAANTRAPWIESNSDAEAMVYRSVGLIAFSTVVGGGPGEVPAVLSNYGVGKSATSWIPGSRSFVARSGGPSMPRWA